MASDREQLNRLECYERRAFSTHGNCNSNTSGCPITRSCIYQIKLLNDHAADTASPERCGDLRGCRKRPPSAAALCIYGNTAGAPATRPAFSCLYNFRDNGPNYGLKIGEPELGRGPDFKP